MKGSIYHIVINKFWKERTLKEQRDFFNMFVIIVLGEFFSVSSLFVSIFFDTGNSCPLCIFGVVLALLAATFCLVNSRITCILNLVFVIPVFIYAFYISDLSPHRIFDETIYFSVWWLAGGLLFLLYFSDSNSKIVFYFVLSLVTLSFHLFKANRLTLYYEPIVAHPLFLYTLFFAGGLLIRKKFKTEAEKVADELNTIAQSVNKVLHESFFSIARIKAIRDEDGNVVQLLIEKVNNAFESTFKISLHEVQGQEASYIFSLLFRTHFDVNKAILFERKKVYEFYARNRERWYKVHVIKPEYNIFYLVFEDISAAKKKLAQLEAGKKRYKVLLEAIPDIFFIINKDGIFEDFVIKEGDLFKMKDVQIVGKSIFEIGFQKILAKKISQLIRICIKNDSLETIEYSLNTPNGTFMFEMRLAKLNAHSVISIARDISQRKTAEIKLEKALKKAEESDRLKSAFLANLSHEIRTPLNIITNSTRLLAEMELGMDEKLVMNEGIDQNSKQLLNMIDNTIHLSEIETDAVNIHIRFCDINSLMRDIYNEYMPLVPDSKEVKLKMKLDVPNKEFGFETDSQLLTNVLKILVDNAIKYTDKGEINLGYEMIRNKTIKFFVSDTGIGIPDEEKDAIFSRFYRIKNSINETTSGSGLGLPIAQHYILLLGGELQMESAPDKGTNVSFSLAFKGGKGYLSLVD